MVHPERLRAHAAGQRARAGRSQATARYVQRLVALATADDYIMLRQQLQISSKKAGEELDPGFCRPAWQVWRMLRTDNLRATLTR